MLCPFLHKKESFTRFSLGQREREKRELELQRDNERKICCLTNDTQTIVLFSLEDGELKKKENDRDLLRN